MLPFRKRSTARLAAPGRFALPGRVGIVALDGLHRRSRISIQARGVDKEHDNDDEWLHRLIIVKASPFLAASGCIDLCPPSRSDCRFSAAWPTPDRYSFPRFGRGATLGSCQGHDAIFSGNANRLRFISGAPTPSRSQRWPIRSQQ